MRTQLLLCTFLVLLAAPSLARPYDEDEYVDEDEPMDPPSPYHPPKASGFEKKSSVAPPPVLSYPTALEGAKSVKPTPPSLLQSQKFKIARPVYVTPPPFEEEPKREQSQPSFTPEEIPPTKTIKTTNKVSVAVQKKKEQQTVTFRPSLRLPQQKKPVVARTPVKDKKIRPSQSILSAKYAHHPSHTQVSYPHFVPTVQPSYQMIPAAQQEYNIATIGGVGLLSGGSVDDAQQDDHQSGYAAGYGHQEEHADSDAKYEFMYRVQGDNKHYGREHEDSHGEPSDFGHSEAREGDRTWGRYYVKLPDGRVQTVRYWADHTGYHAEVLFQGEAQHPEDHPQGTSEYANHAPAYEAEASPSLTQGFSPVYNSQPAYVPTHSYYAAEASELVAEKTHKPLKV